MRFISYRVRKKRDGRTDRRTDRRTSRKHICLQHIYASKWKPEGFHFPANFGQTWIFGKYLVTIIGKTYWWLLSLTSQLTNMYILIKMLNSMKVWITYWTIDGQWPWPPIYPSIYQSHHTIIHAQADYKVSFCVVIVTDPLRWKVTRFMLSAMLLYVCRA